MNLGFTSSISLMVIHALKEKRFNLVFVILLIIYILTVKQKVQKAQTRLNSHDREGLGVEPIRQY